MRLWGIAASFTIVAIFHASRMEPMPPGNSFFHKSVTEIHTNGLRVSFGHASPSVNWFRFSRLQGLPIWDSGHSIAKGFVRKRVVVPLLLQVQTAF